MNNLERDHSETNAKFDKIKDTQKSSVSRRIFNHKYKIFFTSCKKPAILFQIQS